MLTTKDLIDELYQTADKDPMLVSAALVIAFEQGCEFVFLRDTTKLSEYAEDDYVKKVMLKLVHIHVSLRSGQTFA